MPKTRMSLSSDVVVCLIVICLLVMPVGTHGENDSEP
jgi:hypothetical protein